MNKVRIEFDEFEKITKYSSSEFFKLKDSYPDNLVGNPTELLLLKTEDKNGTSIAFFASKSTSRKNDHHELSKLIFLIDEESYIIDAQGENYSHDEFFRITTAIFAISEELLSKICCAENLKIKINASPDIEIVDTADPKRAAFQHYCRQFYNIAIDKTKFNQEIAEYEAREAERIRLNDAENDKEVNRMYLGCAGVLAAIGIVVYFLIKMVC